MLDWPIAPTAPSTMDASEEKITICRQSATAPPNAATATRTKRPIAATFGAVAKKVATGVGAPSYTSGVHMWNGTATHSAERRGGTRCVRRGRLRGLREI